jgi:dCTP deaminase
MILSDGEIEEALANGEIVIDPMPHKSQFTTSAVDLHLGDEVIEFKTLEQLQREEPEGVIRPILVDAGRIDIYPYLQKYAQPVSRAPDGSFILPPQKFILAKTLERIKLPRTIAARVEGRSTLARLGLVVHLTAPTIHAGFSGRIVLEMCNFGTYPLQIQSKNLEVCQLVFERLGREPKGPVRTAYVDQETIR